MKIADIPAKFPIPFADAAGGGYIRAIPEASQIGVTNGAASLTDGFPPLNFLPVGSGGVPPFGQDMNGILNQITQWSQWQGAGGLPIYDAGFSTSIGGYPKGSIVAGTTAGVVWLCTADDNTSNPDTGGANWLQLSTASSTKLRFYGTQIFSTPGTSTYTPSAGVTMVDVETLGGGGGGGGGAASSAGTGTIGAPGSAGAYARGHFTSAFSGVTVTVGAAGASGTGATGGNGGLSSFGALQSSPGGLGGSIGGPSAGIVGIGSGQTALSSGGSIINSAGAPGGVSYTFNGGSGVGGQGGASYFGGGGSSPGANSGGVSGLARGSGGSGTCSVNGNGALTGGAGAPGIVLVNEYGP